MKVISEKYLREILRTESLTWEIREFIADRLIPGCKKLDQLTISKLRPMSEAPKRDEYILATLSRTFEKVHYFDGSWTTEDGVCFDESDFIGWIPMPQYKPEQP